MQLAGKTAVVTGGGAGIGSDIVRQLAVEGARVISVDWNEEDNCQVAASVRAAGGQCEARTADVSSSTDVKRIFEGIGPVDILVNNAAFSKGDGFLLDISEKIWDQTLAICLKSVFLIASAVLFLVSEQASFINGAVLTIDGGLSAVHQLPSLRKTTKS